MLALNARRFAQLPGGIPEGHSDDLFHLLEDIYVRIMGREPDQDDPVFATFEDGFRINCIVDAIVKSHNDGGIWTEVDTSASFR